MALLADGIRQLSAAALGIFCGSQLTEGLVLVPYWRALPPEQFLQWYAANDKRLLRQREFGEVAARAIRVEQRSRHSMIFSFEKMALRDAVKSPRGARLFAESLYDLLHGPGAVRERFEHWCDAVEQLPRKQTRVRTWPLLTVFAFIAQPDDHMFLKPNVTRAAARQYGFEFAYRSQPSWETYASLLEFARTVRRDTKDLRPRDMIDLQSFIWVQGSDEYDE